MTASVLLVGGGGAVGRALLEQWPGCSILVLDRRLPPLPAGIRGHEIDLADLDGLAAMAAGLTGSVHLVHLAASLDNDLSPVRVRQALSDNILGTAGLVSVLAPKLSHLTLVSSISVYGIPEACPVPEDHPIRPTSLYGIGKAGAELVATSLGDLHSVPVTILRPAQLFGLRSAEFTLPHLLVSRMSQGMPMTLRGDPDDERDYLAAGDFVRLLVAQLEAPRRGTFNVGAGEGVSLGTLFARAAQRFGASYEITANTSGASFSQLLDTARVRHSFGWRPETPILDWIDTVDPEAPFEG